MRNDSWAGAFALVVAIVALGLGIAALVLALDDDSPFDGRSLAALRLDAGPEAPRSTPQQQPFSPRRPSAAPFGGGFFTPDGPILGIVVRDEAGAVTVDTVIPGSPAAEAGLQPGDIIVGLDGDEVGTVAALIAAIRARQAGDAVALTVEREGERLELEAILAGPPSRNDSARGAFLG